MPAMTILHEKSANPTCKTLHVQVQAKADALQYHLYIHPGVLTVCKKQLLPGGTGELVRDKLYSLTYTRLGPQKYILTLEHATQGVVLSESVKGHESTTVHKNEAFVVHGFDELLNACFMREFYIPRVQFPASAMPPFALKAVVDTKLKNMALTLATDAKPAALRGLARDRNTRVSSSNPTTRSLLSMQTAQRMLFFNRNAVSRIRSVFDTKPLNLARNVCLCTALAHSGKHAQQGLLLLHTMQYVPLSDGSKKALEELKQQKPASVISYLATKGDEVIREKVPLYKLLPETVQALHENSIELNTPTAYVAFAKQDNQPMFIGNIKSLPLEKTLHPNDKAAYATWHTGCSDSTKRLWLHAAATEHTTLARALPYCLARLADKGTSSVASHAAFELWHAHTSAIAI